MIVSDSDIKYILMLAEGEKPAKRIRQYIENIEDMKVRKNSRIKMFNKTYSAFYTSYFRSFAGKQVENCVLEAYTAALDMLNRGVELEIALETGYKAGSKLYTDIHKHDCMEVTNGHF